MKKCLMILLAILLFGSIEVSSVMANDIEEDNEVLPEIYIKAVNPGYTVDGMGNVGEVIEIARGNSDRMISLAGATVGYTNSSGNYSVLFEFPESSWITGESILLRLASSPNSELAASTYSKTIAFKGGIDLKRNEEVIDSVCWNGDEGCYKSFSSAKPTVLVRDTETLLFEHMELDSYEVKYKPDSYLVEETNKNTEDSSVTENTEKIESIEVVEGNEGTSGIDGSSSIDSNDKNSIDGADDVKDVVIEPQCAKLEFTEILSYYENSKSEQFIEIHNLSTEQVLLNGCFIKYKNKSYVLEGIVRADEYMAYRPVEFGFTKNPTNGNLVELYDVDGTKVDEMFYPNGQKKGTSYALIGYNEIGDEIWKTTYLPTAGTPNIYQEFKTCEEGKVINEATGNCVKVTTVSEKICPEGQYLNVLTGRCRKIVTEEEKTCKDGYYLNPETGRCRKIVENDGIEYKIEPEEFEEKSSFTALYAVIGVGLVGIVILLYGFRTEIGKLCGKVFRRFH